MKKTIIFCCLLAVICTQSVAQQKQDNASLAASKKEFRSKAHELETLIKANEIEKAKSKWIEMQQMTGVFFAAYDQQSREAERSADQQAKTQGRQKLQDQSILLKRAMRLSDNIAGNTTEFTSVVRDLAAKL